MKFLIVLLLSISAHAETIDLETHLKINKYNVDKGDLIKMTVLDVEEPTRTHNRVDVLFRGGKGAFFLDGNSDLDVMLSKFKKNKQLGQFLYFLVKAKGYENNKAQTYIFEVVKYCTFAHRQCK